MERALKLVSVKLVDLGRVLPTLSLGLAKSFFFSFLALADFAIAALS
jgi:hypothetical protein